MGATVLGRHLFALGGNEAAARLSGLKIRRLKAFAYGLSGVLAALTGILFAGRSGQASSQLGIAYELFAITAAVVGGCSLAGGVGSIRGTVLGLILLQILIRGTGIVVRKLDFTLFKTHIVIELNSTQVEGLVLGTVIILAVAINQRFRPKL
jgi:ribose/xylose/arabinose/galactoside ABC-type transport system permease subunit